MSRIDLLVDGVKHRFAVSSASSDSVFPEHLVPSGCLVKREEPRLAGMAGGELNISGSYHTVLQSSDVDFCVPFTLIAGKVSYPVLGNDFLFKMKSCWSPNYLDVVNQNGVMVRLPLTMQHGPEADGTILLPGVQRLSTLEPSFEPTSSPSKGSKRKPKTQVNTRNVVFFHFETTGFGHDSEIIQIAASCHNNLFNVYILLDGDIHPQAAERNGFVKSGDWLFLRGRCVYVTPRRLAVQQLLAFLRGLGGNAVLAAHNAFPFHAPLLAALLASQGLEGQLQALVHGLADTLPLLRKALQGRAAAGKTFSLDDLAKDLMEEKVHFYNAEETVVTLEKLINEVGISDKQIIESAKPLSQLLA